METNDNQAEAEAEAEIEVDYTEPNSLLDFKYATYILDALVFLILGGLFVLTWYQGHPDFVVITCMVYYAVVISYRTMYYEARKMLFDVLDTYTKAIKRWMPVIDKITARVKELEDENKGLKEKLKTYEDK